MLEVNTLSKTYGSGDVATHALCDVSFTVADGEFLAITGKSGSGKSTLLHLLSLLDTPTHGHILLDGCDIHTLDASAQTRFRLTRFGYVFQDYALLSELSAADNVMLPLLMQGYTHQDAVARAHDVLGRLGLEHRVDNRPGQLSGGEQQRVAVARAIANNPKLLFADEPTANLDSETSRVMLDYLRELNRGGQTILMVTHEEEYSRQAKRVLQLADGKLVEDRCSN